MKIAGHTMGLPSFNLETSIKFLKNIGYDGIEIRCAEDGQINPLDFDKRKAREIKDLFDTNQIYPVCLDPYFFSHRSPFYNKYTKNGDLIHEVEALRTFLVAVGELECSKIRVFGWMAPLLEGDRSKTLQKYVTALADVCSTAENLGVVLCVENHEGSLCDTSVHTMEVIQSVNSPNLRILYDPGAMSYENPQSSINMQRDLINHVHVKDVNRQAVPVLLGEGIVPWKTIIKLLKDIGYRDYLTDEYEKIWVKELPEPEVGMKHNLSYLKGLL